MSVIKNKIQYDVTCERIEELLQTVGNDTPVMDKNYIELDLLSDIVAEYEEKYIPIKPPTLIEVIKLRMAEMNLTQLKLSKMLNISPSRVSEYLNGKNEPTLKIARLISIKLNIDANVVLGV